MKELKLPIKSYEQIDTIVYGNPSNLTGIANWNTLLDYFVETLQDIYEYLDEKEYDGTNTYALGDVINLLSQIEIVKDKDFKEEN